MEGKTSMRKQVFTRWWFWMLLGGLTLAACQSFNIANIQPAQSKGTVRIAQVQPQVSTVFYGGATCGPNTVVMQLRIEGNTPGQIGVQYRYVGNSATEWFQAPAQPAGLQLYQASWPVEEARVRAVGANRIEYRAYAVDPQGNFVFEPTQGVYLLAIQPCTMGATGSAPSSPLGPSQPSAPPSNQLPPQNPPGSRPVNPPGSGQSQPPGGSKPPGGNNPGPYPPGSNPGQPPSTGLVIQGVETYPDVVYFGNPCGPDEPSVLEFRLQVNDRSQIASTRLWYRYELSFTPGTDFPNYLDMGPEQGIGDYVASIDLGYELPNHAAVDTIVFYVEVVTTSGQTLTSSVYTKLITPCSGQGSAPSPVTPNVTLTVRPDALTNPACGSPGQLEIEAVVLPSNEVYGVSVLVDVVDVNGLLVTSLGTFTMTYLGNNLFAAGVDLDTLLPSNVSSDTYLQLNVGLDTVQGFVDGGIQLVPFQECTVPQPPQQPPAQPVTPTIVYFGLSQPFTVVLAGDSFTLEWEVQDAACGIYLDGQSVPAVGSKTITTDPATGSGYVTFQLEARGEPCTNPTVVTQEVEVLIRALKTVSSIYIKDMSVGDSHDLDGDGGIDIVFQGGTFVSSTPEQYFLIETASLVYDANQDLLECMAEFYYGFPTMLSSVQASPKTGFCLRTVSGNFGIIYIESMTIVIGDASQNTVTISGYVETDQAP